MESGPSKSVLPRPTTGQKLRQADKQAKVEGSLEGLRNGGRSLRLSTRIKVAAVEQKSIAPASRKARYNGGKPAEINPNKEKVGEWYDFSDEE